MRSEQQGATMIVDTHVHALSADQRKYPRQVSPGAPGEWVQNMSAEMLLALDAQAANLSGLGTRRLPRYPDLHNGAVPSATAPGLGAGTFPNRLGGARSPGGAAV